MKTTVGSVENHTPSPRTMMNEPYYERLDDALCYGVDTYWTENLILTPKHVKQSLIYNSKSLYYTDSSHVLRLKGSLDIL